MGRWIEERALATEAEGRGDPDQWGKGLQVVCFERAGHDHVVSCAVFLLQGFEERNEWIWVEDPIFLCEIENDVGNAVSVASFDAARELPRLVLDRLEGVGSDAKGYREAALRAGTDDVGIGPGEVELEPFEPVTNHVGEKGELTFERARLLRVIVNKVQAVDGARLKEVTDRFDGGRGVFTRTGSSFEHLLMDGYADHELSMADSVEERGENTNLRSDCEPFDSQVGNDHGVLLEKERRANVIKR